jgi:hypothetical protein
MDNLSEYVPLIIIIGSIIYSVIKGGSKKAQQEAAKTTLPGRRAEEPVLTKENVSPKNPVKKQNSPKYNVAASAAKREKGKTLGKMNAKIIPEVEIHLQEEPEYVRPFLDVEDNEEIKRAFIYSEILNRKDY